MAACDLTRPLTQAEREAAFAQQRTGVVRALRPFSGSPTVENLIDYLNRELGPVIRATRNAANDVWKQVVDNAPSANPLSFYFSTTTAAADPTAGRVRLNQATQNTATIIRVSESNARLQSVQPWLDVMSGGPTTPLGTVTLLDVINPGRFLRFDLNTMTDQGAYWDLGVTFIEGSDASPFTDGEAVTVGFIAGVSAAGSTVPVSALTPVARDTFIGNITTATAAPTAVPLANIDSTSIVYDTTAHEMQRAALTGAIAASANANATLFAGIRDNNSAENDRTNLNFVNNAAGSINLAVTDDAGNDELEIAATYVGCTTNINLTNVTGAQGVVDISTLPCGGSVTIQVVTANYSIAGFTAKTDGFWFDLFDRRNASAATVGTLLEDSGATTTSMRNAEAEELFFPAGGRARLYYFNGRWRVLPGLTQRGKLIAATAYTEAAPGSGTHTFDGRARSYLVHIRAGQGGGGGADSAAAQAAVGGQGGEGAEVSVYVTTIPTSVTYTIGAAGTGGSNAGGDGGGGHATVWDSMSVGPGGGGKGSAHATLGSGSGTTLALTMGGTAGVSITGSLRSE